MSVIVRDNNIIKLFIKVEFGGLEGTVGKN